MGYMCLVLPNHLRYYPLLQSPCTQTHQNPTLLRLRRGPAHPLSRPHAASFVRLAGCACACAGCCGPIDKIVPASIAVSPSPFLRLTDCNSNDMPRRYASPTGLYRQTPTGELKFTVKRLACSLRTSHDD